MERSSNFSADLKVRVTKEQIDRLRVSPGEPASEPSATAVLLPTFYCVFYLLEW